MKRFNEDVMNHAIDGLNDCGEIESSELHNRLFNEDYFIIYHSEAEKFLASTEEGVFGAIERVNEYERDNFGQVGHNGDGAEGFANMYAYIEGEEILAESETLQGKWNETLTEDDIKQIIEELEAL